MITTPAEHQRLLRLATRASLAVASILVLSKALAWWLSGSVSLLAGLTDSALDAVASFLNLLAVHYALKPADDDHRYGHGKAEALAAEFTDLGPVTGCSFEALAGQQFDTCTVPGINRM